MGNKKKQLCKWKGDDIDKEFKKLSDIVKKSEIHMQKMRPGGG
jgi:hypothetical protein